MSLVPNIKYKTEYCNYWKEGKNCQKAQNCFFAHGIEELRTIEQNQVEIIKHTSIIEQLQHKSSNYKTIFCKFYAQGKCKLGDYCTYAHDKKQKKMKKMKSLPEQQITSHAQMWNTQYQYLYSHPFYSQNAGYVLPYPYSENHLHQSSSSNYFEYQPIQQGVISKQIKQEKFNSNNHQSHQSLENKNDSPSTQKSKEQSPESSSNLGQSQSLLQAANQKLY